MRASALLMVSVMMWAQTAVAGGTMFVMPDKADTIVMPAQSSLHFHAFTTENGATFDGPVELTGTYYYGAAVIDDGGTGEHSLYFRLDKTSLARLPHFQTRGQPNEIFVTNADAFAKAVIPADQRATALRKGGKYATGKADIWVDKFEAGIECDAPYFNAYFLSVDRPPLRVALADMPDMGC
jgi:hypothetical protein